MSSKSIKLVISCEHANAYVPPVYQYLFRDDAALLTTHAAYDIGALTVAKACASMSIFACYGSMTRLLIDLNRSLTHPKVMSTWSRKLSQEDKIALQQDYYLPYRLAILKNIQQLQTECRVIHIAVHSFTPVWHDVLRNADIGLLYDPRHKTECDFAKRWQQHLRMLEPTWHIRRNYPYQGKSDGLCTWLRTQFSDQSYMGLELEINQALLSTPAEAQSVAQIIVASLQGVAHL